MSMYDLDAILQMWSQEKLTTEQAVGQLLLHLRSLSGRVGWLERQVAQTRAERETRRRLPPDVKADE